MLERFRGKAGRTKLTNVLKDQELVLQDEELARALAQEAETREHAPGKQIYVQGEPGNHELYFVIEGEVRLVVDGKPRVTLTSRQAFGEFPIVDDGMTYTVTVECLEKTTIATVPEKAFKAIAATHPKIWENMCKMLVTRLRNKTPDVDPSGRHNNGDETPTTIWHLLRNMPLSQWMTVVTSILAVISAVWTAAYYAGKNQWFE
jgi:CRP/FNR family transcriptional regulator, cyclic AMP receptor protein